RGIPDELREAARVDGASELNVYRKVVLPILNPVMVTALIVLGHISLKIFDLVFVMTGGGPFGTSTDVPSIYMYISTFSKDHVTDGAVIATVMLLLVSVVIVPYLIVSTRGEVEV